MADGRGKKRNSTKAKGGPGKKDGRKKGRGRKPGPKRKS